jgi:hypothetical protein
MLTTALLLLGTWRVAQVPASGGARDSQWEQTPSLSPGGYFSYSNYDLAGNLTSTTNAAATISYAHDAGRKCLLQNVDLNKA